MNPMGFTVAATIVALVNSCIGGLAAWRWLKLRRTNQALRARLGTYRHLAAETGRLNDLFDQEM